MFYLSLDGQSQQVFGGVDIGFDGANGVFRHQFDSDCSSEVEDDFHSVHGFAECDRVCDGGGTDFESVVVAYLIEIYGSTCGEVIEDNDGVSLREQQFGEVAADES
ncbi:hypothetical protein E3A20_03010 [Planctomyces bekefii]|uniref:Uncharacterized protein n=1 Tax=Planctomyces bekefii TaxID=1653850 RepID=A0A5C6MBY3_9PLAN|nr:hypothetical protein E3A20_03010 [Planctomyces bekefii]